MEKCFDFIMELYDENEEKRYYGEGGLVVRERLIEGYIANDYLKIEQKGEICEFELFNIDSGWKMKTRFIADCIEFPGIIEIEVSKNRQISFIVMQISPAIKNFEKFQKTKEILQRVKKLHFDYS